MSDYIKNGYIIPYNRNLKERARALRNNSTEYEKKLWYKYLRELDIHFYRQKPIDNYIVDFYAPKLKLVIEIDGDSHYTSEAIEYDIERTEILNGCWLTVIRFTNNDVKDNFEGVCEEINRFMQNSNIDLVLHTFIDHQSAPCY